MNNTFLRFAKKMTKYAPELQKKVVSMYRSVFEGAGTDAALDALRGQVGDNPRETQGDGVFGLSAAAGFADANGHRDPEAIDKAIDDGLAEGGPSDFGTAIATETIPTEDDLGLGSDPDAQADDMFGGGGDIFADDGGEDLFSDDDLGLDGADDPFDEPGDGDDKEANKKQDSGDDGAGDDDLAEFGF